MQRIAILLMSKKEGLCLFLLIAAALFGSCTRQKMENEKNIVKAKGKKIHIDESCVSAISIYDQILLITDHCDSNVFHVYSTKDFKKMGAFGRLGEGPGELALPNPTDQYEIVGDSLYFWISDGPALIKSNLTQNLNDESFSVIKEVRHANPLTNSAYIFNDSTVIGSASDTDGAFFLYNMKRNTSYVKPYYFENQEVSNLSMMKKSVLFNACMGLKPGGSKFVLAYDLFKRIDIFNENIRLDKSINHGRPIQDISQTDRRMEDETVRYYVDVNVTDDFVYALNWEMTFKNYLNQKNVPTSLEVYDWTGKHVITYQFDNRIVAVAIDENNHQIIGLNDAVEDFQFRVFNMTHL